MNIKQAKHIKQAGKANVNIPLGYHVPGLNAANSLSKMHYLNELGFQFKSSGAAHIDARR